MTNTKEAGTGAELTLESIAPAPKLPTLPSLLSGLSTLKGVESLGSQHSPESTGWGPLKSTALPEVKAEPPATPVSKMTRAQLRPWSVMQARKQGMLCPLCKTPFNFQDKGSVVVDHDHTTGRIRGVLHRSCNGALGRVDTAAGRWGAKSMAYPAILAWLKNMVAYYEQEPLPFIYPFHKTEDELRVERLKKRRESAARQRAKARIKESS